MGGYCIYKYCVAAINCKKSKSCLYSTPLQIMLITKHTNKIDTIAIANMLTIVLGLNA